MVKKQGLIEKVRMLYEQTDDVTKRLESELRQEFLSYIKNIRNHQKLATSKEVLNTEIVSTAKSIISSLLSNSTKQDEGVKK